MCLPVKTTIAGCLCKSFLQSLTVSLNRRTLIPGCIYTWQSLTTKQRAEQVCNVHSPSLNASKMRNIVEYPKDSCQSRDVKKPQKDGIVESLVKTVLFSHDDFETDRTITRVTFQVPCRDSCMICANRLRIAANWITLGKQ